MRFTADDHQHEICANSSFCPLSPDKVLAMTAECGMLEEPRDELVVLDLADVLLLEGAFPHPGLHGAHGLVAAGAIGVVHVFILRHLCREWGRGLYKD